VHLEQESIEMINSKVAQLMKPVSKLPEHLGSYKGYLNFSNEKIDQVLANKREADIDQMYYQKSYEI